MVHVLAILTAKPGQRAPLVAAFHANIPAVRAESGCIEYGIALDAEPVLKFQTAYGPDVVVVVEKWESLDALKAHGAAPHMVAFGAKTREFVASRSIHILQPA